MATITEPTPIDPDCLYTLRDFMALTGLGKHAMRTARENGLRVRRVGNRAFVHGGDFISYVDSRDRDVQAQE